VNLERMRLATPAIEGLEFTEDAIPASQIDAGQAQVEVSVIRSLLALPWCRKSVVPPRPATAHAHALVRAREELLLDFD
jgi:hypothetical protein